MTKSNALRGHSRLPERSFPSAHQPRGFFSKTDWSGTIFCPLHDEKTPSCVVKDGTFRCLGCGATGVAKLVLIGQVIKR